MGAKIPVPPLGADAVTADDFQVYSAPSLVRFLSRGVQPPSYVYLKHTDTLQVACATSQAGESVTFNYRLLRADSSLIKGQFTIQVPATRAVVTQKEPMAEGFLVSLSCKAAVATTRGQTFARVFLTSGALGPNQPSYTLMADYVTTQFAPAHPNGRVLTPVEGPGWTHAIATTVPAAGADWFITVPANARWRIDTFLAQLTTGAAVANRLVKAVFLRGGTFVFESPATAVQAASLAVNYSASKSSVYVGGTGELVLLSLPHDVVAGAGDELLTLTTNLQAADQWTASNLSIEEWLDNV